MLNSFNDFYLCIKSAIMWYPDNELKKKFNLCMLLQANKNIFCKESNKSTKYVLAI